MIMDSNVENLSLNMNMSIMKNEKQTAELEEKMKDINTTTEIIKLVKESLEPTHGQIKALIAESAR